MLIIIDKQGVKVKTKLLSLIILTASTIGMSGCVINIGDEDASWDKGQSWQATQAKNRANLSKLTIGMDREQVITLMGTADFSEAYIKQDREVTVLYYRTQRTKEDGTTTKEECTPIVLANNQVIGWGNAAYDNL